MIVVMGQGSSELHSVSFFATRSVWISNDQSLVRRPIRGRLIHLLGLRLPILNRRPPPRLGLQFRNCSFLS